MCPLCHGDGMKCVPVSNPLKLTLMTANGNVTPKYVTRIEGCECVKAKEDMG